jgi:hypothetical protein
VLSVELLNGMHFCNTIIKRTFQFNTQHLTLSTILLIFFLSCSPAVAQKEYWAIGVSGMYDFQTNGLGGGVRAYIPVWRHLAVSPQFNYYFPFDKVHEYYAGLALQYSLFPNRRWSIYPLFAGYFNKWQNASDFTGKNATANNIAEEGGIGIMKGSTCWRPFAELRYDFKWSEYSLHIGILYSFGDCHRRAIDVCPAYF